MADDADRVTERQEIEEELRRRYHPVVKTLNHTGQCHWCNEDVVKPKLFCNGDCASDHAKYGET